jgi:N-acetyltransferase 10
MARFAIDDSTDFSGLEPQVRALADAPPEVKSRLNTTMSVRSTAPEVKETEGKDKGKKEDKAKSKGKEAKGKRRESGAGDAAGRKKQKV